eukprot:gnl/Trimastix_PCT/14.p1 GENE.gnl/Trimastix_PCT/14~~gnl/Trimastix_PCT/14.p1  ORF type:complete len:259 (-),score=118.38 gnl/Trimastix_PCT/14:85-825(-)
MAFGKNKRLSSGGKKGGKKKIVDPFTRKEWYDVKVPKSLFEANQIIGKTCVNKSAGTRNCVDDLKGRVFEVSLADLTANEDDFYLKLKMRCVEVMGRNCLTTFHGLNLTTDKLKGLVRKFSTLVEGNVDVRTVDGYHLRLFAIGFTRKRPNQIRKTSYAQASQVRQIRKKMVDIMKRRSTGCDLKELVKKLTAGSISKEITKACAGIYPLQNVFIRKVKMIKAAKFDAAKLAELYETSTEETGSRI